MPAFTLGQTTVVRMGRTNVKADAEIIHLDEDLTTHTFNNPTDLRADSGPNTGPRRRSNRYEDATYNVTPLVLEETLDVYTSAQGGATRYFWIAPYGEGTGEPEITFEAITTCSITNDGGFKRWNLTAMMNDRVTVNTL